MGWRWPPASVSAVALALPPFTTAPKTTPGGGGQLGCSRSPSGATPPTTASWSASVFATPGQGGTDLLPSVRAPHCANLRQMKPTGDFEGVVSFGLGLRRKTGFRVFRLTRPARTVVDVAH